MALISESLPTDIIRHIITITILLDTPIRVVCVIHIEIISHESETITERQ